MMVKGVILAGILLAIPVMSYGKVLGSAGVTYQIIEPDALGELEEAAAKFDWKGASARLLAQGKAWKPVLPRLPEATVDRVRTIKTSYTLDTDIVNPRDMTTVIYPKGYTFNPLDYTRISSQYVFIDGNNPKHIAFAKSLPDAKILLTGGDLMTLRKKLGRNVYYADERVVKLFGVEVVPSIVDQQGNTFRLKEKYVPKYSN